VQIFRWCRSSLCWKRSIRRSGARACGGRKGPAAPRGSCRRDAAAAELIESICVLPAAPGRFSLLDDWTRYAGKFVKVFPNEYKRRARRLHERQAAGLAGDTGQAARGRVTLRRKRISQVPPAIAGDGTVMGKVTVSSSWPALPRLRWPVEERIRSYREFILTLKRRRGRGAGSALHGLRHSVLPVRLPINNIIPDWNDLVYRHQWRQALDVLHSTNNFPEFTGRVCPAPCEAACTLNINDDPVGIKSIEHFIIDKAGKEGWVVPLPPATKTGKRVAVIGSGPAGMACAQQLARAGHDVVLFEKSDRIGGLLRYGIPDFKMGKHHIDRRVQQNAARRRRIPGQPTRGRNRRHGVDARELVAEYDAVVLSAGSEHPRDLDVPGRELDGVHFAMDFLPLQNKRVAGDSNVPPLTASGKHVVVIGGGDTGSDCVGTSNRQGASSVTQFELLPQPPSMKTAAGGPTGR